MKGPNAMVTVNVPTSTGHIPATFAVDANKASLKPPSDSEILELRRLANDCLTAEKLHRASYFELCKFIHSKQFTPSDLTRELVNLGFRKDRIAEIKRVCFTSDKIFEDYMARLIGFRAALSKARRQVRGQDEGQRRWLTLCNEFERLFAQHEPQVPHYQGNGFCLVMFRQSEVEQQKRRQITFDGYRVQVERLEKQQTKKQMDEV